MLGLLRFEPILLEKVWGGERLRDLAGKAVPAGARVGESWELSDRPGAESRVAEGPAQGRTLRQLLEEHGRDIYGAAKPQKNGRFPLLIKFIEAAQPLSAQVHPDDARCERDGLADLGKTECWYLLAPPERGVQIGLKPGASRERLRAALRAGRVEEWLRYEPAGAGDMVFCPAGTAHAAMPPMVFVEIQQNSDVTYRLYDWGRVGLDGKPRELHVDQALEAIQFGAAEQSYVTRASDEPFQRMVDCDKFTVDRRRLSRGMATVNTEGRFVVAVAVAGAGEIAGPDGAAVRFRAGDTVLLPAAMDEATVRAGTALAWLEARAKV
ncbi:MAG TPA: class I mannose-6-phosphate isomerase [Candidatus Brocadiia bacterium]|nr:class I mannose-6-phosphate isomerase [Candidatus Brocadiia bacterium]